MDDGSRLSWILVVLLILAAFFFAAAETAYASVSEARLRADADHGSKKARRALYVKENMDRAITTILICTNIAHLAAASVVTVAVTRSWGASYVTISTLLTTLVVFFFGEMLPKSIARKYAYRISLGISGIMCGIMAVLKPFAAVLTSIGNAASRLTKGEPETTVTENELYDIIEDMTEEGTLDEEQGALISQAIQFGDVTAESVLTSRVDLAAIDVNMPQDELLAFIKEVHHSRIPVYENTIDNIIGILQIRRYLKHYIRRGGDARVRDLMDEPFFVHQSALIHELLSEMSSKKINLAVVTDNYGGTKGIVTIEDILEELVGEIWDEDDLVVRNIVPLPDGSFSVNAEEHVLDVLDELSIDVSDALEEELKGKLMNELAFEEFSSIPKEGDSFTWRDLVITVTSMRHNRILRLRVRNTDSGDTAEYGRGGLQP